MKLRNVEWLANTLGCSRHRAYQLARERIVPSVRIGRAVRFNEDAVREFIERGGKPLPGGWRREAQ